MEKNIAHTKDLISKLNSLLTSVRMKCDDGKYEEALEALDVRYSRDEVAQDKLQQLAKISYADKEAELPALAEQLKVCLMYCIFYNISVIM